MKQISTPEPYANINMIASVFGLSRWTVAKYLREMAADKAFGGKVFRIGRQYRVRISDFEAYAGRSIS